jgi:CHAT domain-containing protein
MNTRMQITSFNAHVLIVCLLFLIGCSAPDSRPNDFFLQNLHQQGLSAYQKGNYRQAESQWQQGFNLTGHIGELNEWAARFALSLARIAETIGHHERAVQLSEQALQRANDIRDKTLESETHIIIAQANRGMGNHTVAEHHAELARQLAFDIGDLHLASDSSRTLGAIRKDQGQPGLAKTLYEEAFTMAQEANDRLLQAKALNNLGELSQRMGHYKDARNQYIKSLQLRESIHEMTGQVNVLGNICRIYQSLNDFDKALTYCLKSLTLARKIEDRAGEAKNLNSIAVIFQNKKDYNQALTYLRQSLSLKQQLRDRSGEAHSLNNMGHLYRLEGKHEQALEYFAQSLNIKKELKDPMGESVALLNISLSHFDRGHYREALQFCNEALFMQLTMNNPEILWRIYSQLSDIYQRSGRTGTAIVFGKHAVNTIQSIRTFNQELEEQLQQSYLKDKTQVYEKLANLLIDRGRLWEAQEVLDMLKEEEYFDFIQRGAKEDSRQKSTTFTEKEEKVDVPYQALTSRLYQIGQEYMELSQKNASGMALSSEEQQHLEELSAYLEQAKRGYQQWLDQLQQVFDQRSDFGITDSLDRYQQSQSMLSEFKGNTVLIYYLMNDEKLRIILISNNTSSPPKVLEDPISRVELNRLIFAFNRKLLNRDPVDEEALPLFEHLIHPIEEDLKTLKASTLMIYPYQSLRYLPFSTLYDGSRYLVESYALAIYNAAANQYSLSKTPNSHWRVAGFGVSESLDPDHQLGDLPYVEDEINAIVKDENDDNDRSGNATGILPGRRFLNQAFTPDTLMETLKQRETYQVLHLATHFVLKRGADSLQESFLLAGDGTHITLDQLHYRDYQMAGKQLITLSACNTASDTDDPNAIDSESTKGKEVEGLGTLIQRLGADAVLATLWEVDDCSTALFMKEFYSQREKRNLTKAEAVRQAQIRFIKGDLTIRNCRKAGTQPTEQADESGFKLPFYWAPFILMGNFQ